MEAVDTLSRWAHVFTAVVLVGGAVFQRIALLPVLKGLPEDQRNALREQITARWARVIHVGIGVLLLTGFYNYLNATGQDPLYHSLVGTKILLAIAVFFIASALVGRAEDKGCGLEDLSLADMRAVEPAITARVFDVLGVDNSVKSRTSHGGTAPDNVRRAAAEARRRFLVDRS